MQFKSARLILAHCAFRYDPSAADPASNRMDSVHRCAVAFLFRSFGVRRSDVMYVVFANGVLRLTSDVRNGFPRGCNAASEGSFLHAVFRGGRGASFSPHMSSIRGAFRDLVRPGSACLALDSTGVNLELSGETKAKRRYACPESATYVVGGPRGYSPLNFDQICSASREAAGSNFFPVSLNGPQQFASAVIAFLQVTNDASALRPAVDRTFYGDGASGRGCAEVKYVRSV